MRGRGWSCAQLWLVGLLFLSPGCAETGFDLPPLSPLPFEELKQRVSRLRGLPFQQEVSIESRPAEAIQAVLENSLWQESEKKNLQQKAQVYARLGLIPELTDLPKALLALRLFRWGAFPDSRRNTIILPQEPSKPALTLLGLSSMAQETTKQLLITYALSYLLQEQHFHWEEKIRNGSTEDLRLTLRSLREGDAALVALAHIMGDSKENRQRVINGLQGLSGLPERINRELSELPGLLRQKVVFQYLQGSRFVSWAYSLRGWDGVNSIFLHPPVSTKQILHPERYYVKREDPVRIVPWALIRRFDGRKVMDETLGEFLIQSLLSRTLSEEEAKQAAAGWAGDSLLAFRQGAELVLGWVTAWDDREEAKEFYASFLRALERRHGASFKPFEGGGDILAATLPGGHPLLLQLRDRFVFFSDGISAPFFLNMAEELWSNLETSTEAEPLDLAQRSRQSFPLKK